VKHRKTIIAAASITALVGLYALLGFYWVPRFIQSRVVEIFGRDYDRQAELGAVRFNPFTFELEARSFSVPDDDGGRLLGFERLYVDFELASAVNRAWTFAAIDLEGPYVRVVQRAGGGINLADLAPPPRDDEPGGEPAGIPALRIGRLGIASGRIDVEDRTRPEPFTTTLAPVSFTLEDFRTAGDGNRFAFEAGSDRAGRLVLEGGFGVAPLTSTGTLSLTGLTAGTISDYLGELLPLEILGGQVDLSFNYDFRLAGDPFTLTIDMPLLTVRELETVARGHEVPWRVAAIELRESTVDVAARNVRMGQVELRDVSAPMWLDAQEFSLPGVVPRIAEQEAPPAGQTDGAAPTGSRDGAWRVAISEIAVLDARIDFDDRQAKPVAALGVVVPELRIGGFALPAAGPLSVAARVESDSGGEFSAAGELLLDPLQASLDVEVDALDLAPAQAYLVRHSGVDLKSGELSASLRVEYERTEGSSTRISGDATIADLRTRDRARKEDLLTWKRLDLRGLRYADRPAGLKIGQITATGPFLRLILGADGVTNIQHAIDPEGAARKVAELAAEREARQQEEKSAGGRKKRTSQEATGTPAVAAQAAAGSPGLPIDIGVVKIVDGSTKFTDRTLEPNFEIAVEALAGTVEGLTSATDGRAKVGLAGQVDRYAPARIDGEINPLAAQAFIDIAASFRNIELTTFDPYSGKFAGYHIEKGKLSIETRYKVENRQLDAEHKFIVNQLELGDKVDSPDAVSLPLKLAVALLKDSNGVIDLDLPISGSLDDPQFKLGPIIWKAFLGLITKIVTAPFALLGSLVGGGEELSYVDFAPGAVAPGESEQGKLDSLRKALAERPALSLDIPSPVVPDADRRALAEARWAAAVSAAGQPEDAPDATWRTDRQEYLRRLRTMYRESTGSKPDIPDPPKPAEGEPPVDLLEHAIAFLEPGLKSAVSVPDEEVAALGTARAEAVRDALLGDGGVDPARVFIITGEAAELADGAVRMKLSLK